MQKSKTGKFSIFSPLDAKLGFLAGRVASGWKYEQPDPISVRVQNVNPKPDPTISLSLSEENSAAQAYFFRSWVYDRSFEYSDTER